MNATVIHAFTILMVAASIAFIVYSSWQIRRRAAEVNRLIESERSRIAGETRPVVISLGEVETKELYSELCRRNEIVALVCVRRFDEEPSLRWNCSGAHVVVLLRHVAEAVQTGNLRRLDEQ